MSSSAASNRFYTFYVSLIVALGGFLMGFDASVISGVVKFIEVEFSLSKIQLGWSVASLTLTATLAMMVSGPLSDRYGRKKILVVAALLFTVSALASALANSFTMLVAARMLGGFGVGAALIIAPMYIAELAPAHLRGRLVSLNQLNIVIGISAAFFSNYLILQLGDSSAQWAQSLRFEQWNWRWMLGLETLPAILYLACLVLVPESPRWLTMKKRDQEALDVLSKANGATAAQSLLQTIKQSLQTDVQSPSLPIRELFSPAMKLVMVVGVSVAVLQQITGINAVFFYAPMIFEQAGFTTNAAFMQAILVGLINLVFTLLAIGLIDRLGRKSLLAVGVAGITLCMFTLAYGFSQASFTLTPDNLSSLSTQLDVSLLQPLLNVTYQDELVFKDAILSALGPSQASLHESALVTAAISLNQNLILFGILGFVACFALSLGPVMWVLFSELFPNRIRGLAISFVGLINSAVSFGVQLIFPWELANLGAAYTFLIFGLFALAGLVIIFKYVPETKGKSLEELEALLVRNE